MRATLLRIAVLCLIISAGFAADAESDQKAMQGTWSGTKVVVDGKAGDASGLKLTISGDQATIKKGDMVIMSAKVKLDPSKTPAQADMAYTDGPNKGSTNLAIYQIKGDELTFCSLVSPGGERPKAFSSEANSGLRLSVYKKDK